MPLAARGVLAVGNIALTMCLRAGAGIGLGTVAACVGNWLLPWFWFLYAESYRLHSQPGVAAIGDPIRPDRDLFAFGRGQCAQWFAAGMPVGAGYSASAANEAVGARTR